MTRRIACSVRIVDETKKKRPTKLAKKRVALRTAGPSGVTRDAFTRIERTSNGEDHDDGLVEVGTGARCPR